MAEAVPGSTARWEEISEPIAGEPPSEEARASLLRCMAVPTVLTTQRVEERGRKKGVVLQCEAATYLRMYANTMHGMCAAPLSACMSAGEPGVVLQCEAAARGNPSMLEASSGSAHRSAAAWALRHTALLVPAALDLATAALMCAFAAGPCPLAAC